MQHCFQHLQHLAKHGQYSGVHQRGGERRGGEKREGEGRGGEKREGGGEEGRGGEKREGEGRGGAGQTRVHGQMQRPMQECIIAEQQVFMGTKKARVKKAATADSHGWVTQHVGHVHEYRVQNATTSKLAMYLPEESSAWMQLQLTEPCCLHTCLICDKLGL